MKHVREFKLNEETGWAADPLDSPQPQELALRFLIGLNKGQYKAEIPPTFKEPDTMEDEGGNFKDEVDIKIKDSEYSLYFHVSWSYRVEAGMRSPKPHELPDDPDHCILTYMDITKLYLYDGEGTESEITVTKEINKLSITYLEDFVNVDEIDL